MKGAIKRIGALFYARNLEFVRDRAALVWNLAFPLLLVIGFSLIFSGPPKPLVQMGVVGDLPAAYAPLNAIPLLKLIPYDDEQKGRLKVRHHQLDLLLSPGSGRVATGSTRMPPRGRWPNTCCARRFFSHW